MPKIQDENRAKKILWLCASYFFFIVILYIALASIKFGSWSFKSSDTYFRIFENIVVGLTIFRSWRVVVRIFLILQILLLINIFIGGYGLKIINSMSLIVLFYADFAVNEYMNLKKHITTPCTGFAGPGH